MSDVEYLCARREPSVPRRCAVDLQTIFRPERVCRFTRRSHAARRRSSGVASSTRLLSRTAFMPYRIAAKTSVRLVWPAGLLNSGRWKDPAGPSIPKPPTNATRTRGPGLSGGGLMVE